jgi:hypothetical protein
MFATAPAGGLSRWPMRGYILFAAALVCVLPGLASRSLAAKIAEDVSIVQLLATPEKFNGKFVRVFGFLSLEFEGDALYLHREDYVQGLTKNGMWVDRTGEMERNAKKLNMHYVLIEATFDADDHGHMGLFRGR